MGRSGNFGKDEKSGTLTFTKELEQCLNEELKMDRFLSSSLRYPRIPVFEILISLEF